MQSVTLKKVMAGGDEFHSVYYRVSLKFKGSVTFLHMKNPLSWLILPTVYKNFWISSHHLKNKNIIMQKNYVRKTVNFIVNIYYELSVWLQTFILMSWGRDIKKICGGKCSQL